MEFSWTVSFRGGVHRPYNFQKREYCQYLKLLCEFPISESHGACIHVREFCYLMQMEIMRIIHSRTENGFVIEYHRLLSVKIQKVF